MIINGKDYNWDNIEVRVSGKIIDRIISVRYDGFKSVVEFLKSEDIKLIYGKGNLPVSIECPKGYKMNELLEIDCFNVPFEDWNKY